MNAKTANSVGFSCSTCARGQLQGLQPRRERVW